MWDFGRAERLEPEAIGEPGQRTFRLRALSGNDTASLWLEKEQLAALTLAIRQLLEQTSSGETPAEPAAPAPDAAFPDQAQVDFKIGRLGLGYDEAKRMVVIFAYAEGEAEEEDKEKSPTFSCQVTRGQCRSFAERAEEVISAGRPICLLCGAPLDRGGHKCQRRNGHSPRPIPTE
jgi:uncharacterized repeat protein (TIGR03847 family)